MLIRVPVAVRNRLKRVEARRPVSLPIGGWPPIMAVDEWEALASRIQDELVDYSRFDFPPKQAAAKAPATLRKAADGHGEPPPLSAVEGYLAAQLAAREARIPNQRRPVT